MESVLVSLFCVLVLMPVWSLCGYHFYLIGKGETTKERIMATRGKTADEEAMAPRRSLGQETREARDQAESMNCCAHWRTLCQSPPTSALGDMSRYELEDNTVIVAENVAFDHEAAVPL